MKVSLNIVKSLIDFDLPSVDELLTRINARLGGVEDVINLGSIYKDAKVVKIVECEKHPDADKLSVCKIDAGEAELVQVVCGAPNARADIWAVWLPPKSIVPCTANGAEPFKLDARKLRGVMSYGMLAAGDELGINDNHEGIIEITNDDLLPGRELIAGASFAKLFGLDDVVIEIENKMFTHRPDLFGQLGVAREIAGIFGKKFSSPSWYQQSQHFTESNKLPLEVFNEANDKSARFMAVAIDDVKVGPSPLWLQCALVAMGSKSINNVVDATNYAMLITAQPTHAYDYDKLRGNKLGVRMANAGESVRLLNDKTYELSSDDIVIVDGEGPVGLAGIMGGGDSEVSSDTTRIVLEVANFDMYAVRRSSMRHGLFTDALARFNKGQSPLQTEAVLAYLMSLVGGNQASEVFDVGNQSKIDRLAEINQIEASFINDRLGSDMTPADMATILNNVEINVTNDQSKVYFNDLPFWRTDIALPEDVVEEVGRLHGFDVLPRELPKRSAKPAPKNINRVVKQKIRDSFRRSGANEVVTYSFVHENVIKNAKQDVSWAFKLSNALSPDLQYYRLSVLPSLLDKVHMNIKAGHDEFTLFEIGKGHNKKYHVDDADGLPGEINFVDAVYASKRPHDGAAYYYVKRMVSQLADDYGLSLKFKPITEEMDCPVTAPFDLSRSATIETKDGIFIGIVGELDQVVIKNFKLPQYVAAMTLDFEGLKKAISNSSSSYRPLSKYPSITRDVSISVKDSVLYETIYSAAESFLNKIEEDIDITPVGIYKPEGGDTKNVTLRVKITPYSKTLSGDEASKIIEKLTEAICQSTDGSVV